MRYKLRSKVWLYPGKAGWHFVNVSKEVSKEIRENFAERRRGFGSVRVIATAGKTSWKTSAREQRFRIPLRLCSSRVMVKAGEGGESMLDNHVYNLITQFNEESKSLWRIKRMYQQDAGGCSTCGPFWQKLAKDKEDHINELAGLIKQHL